MKRLLLLCSVLLASLPLVGAAQTPTVVEGLQVIAERQYASDPTKPINLEVDGAYLASARVYLFDTEENANTTWETLIAAESVANELPADDDSISYETTELDDVGDRAMILSLKAEIDDGKTGMFRTVVVQRGSMLVTVTVIAGSDDSAKIADTIATAMIDRNAGEGESTYDGMGGSEGGVWDVFLPADAEELGGLQAYADKETRPA